MTVKSILMVCRGNICRSPMAEGFFQHQLKDTAILITSAGISALVDHPADTHAQITMQQRHIDLSKHRARQLTEALVRKSDLILVMTQSHLQLVTSQFSTAKGKTFLIGHWQGFEIKDPYTLPSEAFETVYQQLHLAWQDWKPRIVPCQTTL